jgi:nucleotide-binding universal stress UspA family protein
MTTLAGGTHTLVLYRSSDRADTALRSLCQRARDGASRVTVVALARQEDPRNGCCDTRSVLWNEVCRDLANQDLSRASQAVGNQAGVEFEVLTAPDRKVVDAITREAIARGADEIVLANPRASGLGGLERRRLRRRSMIPISA